MVRRSIQRWAGIGVLFLAATLASCSRSGEQAATAPSEPAPQPPVPKPWSLGLPTANEYLFQPGAEESFFQSTVMGTWMSGQYGCVRKASHGGPKFHEGVDIKCLQRDEKGEPVDPVMAISDGTVVFFNKVPGNSNYGRYVVLRHQWSGVEVFSFYAHLREIDEAIRVGRPVVKGAGIGTLGRSTNTREGISRDRAHVHLEINFMVNDHFRYWYAKRDPKAPDFGNFNGQNFIGIDPAPLFHAHRADASLDFAAYLRALPEAFRVQVPAKDFYWVRAHPESLETSNDPPVAYEVALTYAGLPIRIIPRPAAGASKLAKTPVLVSVDEAELTRNNCRYLVRKENGRWTLTKSGLEWIELLTYTR